MAFFNDAIVRVFGYDFVDWDGNLRGKNEQGEPYLPDVPVTRDSHAYKSDVVYSIELLADRVSANDVLIVYLRSHGFSSGLVSPNGSNWSYDVFLDLIYKVSAKTVFMIVEGCKSCRIQASALAKFSRRNFLLLCSSLDSTRDGVVHRVAFPWEENHISVRVAGKLLPALLQWLDGTDASLETILAGRCSQFVGG